MVKDKLQVLVDITGTGKKIDWAARKVSNEYLAAAYDEIDSHIAERLRNCATFLVYGVGEDGRRRLRQANFCRVRLCPICQWRRSLKLYGQMRAVMRYQLQHEPMRYIFLTLTMRNVKLNELSDGLDRIIDGFHRLMKYKAVVQAVQGWYRGLEVTHNLDLESSSYNTYHPHLHVMLAVRPSYFKKGYIKQTHWAELWSRALGVDYTPVCDVRAIKGDDAKSVCEATKYAAKSKDYIILDDWDLTIETVRGLAEALHGRRLVGFGGCLLEARRALRQEDIEKGDLVKVGEDEGIKDLYTESYAWHNGYCQYIKEPD